MVCPHIELQDCGEELDPLGRHTRQPGTGKAQVSTAPHRAKQLNATQHLETNLRHRRTSHVDTVTSSKHPVARRGLARVRWPQRST